MKITPSLFSLLPLAAIAQDNLLVAQDAAGIVNLSELAKNLYADIGNATGTNALQKALLKDDVIGFKCALVVVKGNEMFHTHDNADLFGTVIHGGGYVNVGDGESVQLQVGDNILIEAGQTHQVFNKADDYTAAIACFFPNDSSDQKLIDDNPGPEFNFTSSPAEYATFKTMDGTVVDILALKHLGENETRAVYPMAHTEKMSVATVVLATTDIYHVHENSALLVVVVKGTVETSSAKDEDEKISVPKGSFILLDRCTPHKFVNLNTRENPAILLAFFGPALATGDSPAVEDAECLTTEMTTSNAGKAGVMKTCLALWVAMGLFVA